MTILFVAIPVATGVMLLVAWLLGGFDDLPPDDGAAA